MKTWIEIVDRPARVAKPYSEPSASKTGRGRRLTWTTYEKLTGCSRPQGAVDQQRQVKPLNLPPAPQRRQQANDNTRPVPNIPTGNSTPDRVPNALRDDAPAAYRTLCRLRELARPADVDQIDAPLAGDNDNAADETGFGVEYRHDIEPGNGQISHLLNAFADGMRSRVVIDSKGRVDRFNGGVRYHCAKDGTDEIIEIGGRSSRGKFFGLTAHRGAIVAYGKDGKKIYPSYTIGDARGSDDAELPRETTASTAAHPTLAEMDRADSFADLAARLPTETASLLGVILNADTFQEIASAAGKRPTAHNGRRATIATLKRVEEIWAEAA